MVFNLDLLISQSLKKLVFFPLEEWVESADILGQIQSFALPSTLRADILGLTFTLDLAIKEIYE